MKLQIQKHILAAFITLANLLLLPILALVAQHRLIRVVDGDTIIVDYYGKAEKVRLLCVNTPESVHPDPSKNVPMGKVTLSMMQRLVQISVKAHIITGQRPAGSRPRLYLHGLSLGALNSDLSSDMYDIVADPFHGALRSGPPRKS